MSKILLHFKQQHTLIGKINVVTLNPPVGIWRGCHMTHHKDHHKQGPLHTRDREHVTTSLQALSLVEKAKLVQVLLHTTLEDPMECVNARWMYAWHQMNHVFMVTCTISKKPPLGGKPTTKPGDHGTPNVHNLRFILFYYVWGPACIEIRWNCIRLRAHAHMNSHDTWRFVTALHEFGSVSGRSLQNSLLGSHDFMVTALGPTLIRPTKFLTRSVVSKHKVPKVDRPWSTW